MRSKLFMIWAATRWLLLMFLIAPGLEAPLVAHSSQPIKPLKVWMGLASWYGPGFEGRKTAKDRKSTRLNSSHANISYAVFCLKKKNIDQTGTTVSLID